MSLSTPPNGYDLGVVVGLSTLRIYPKGKPTVSIAQETQQCHESLNGSYVAI